MKIRVAGFLFATVLILPGASRIPGLAAFAAPRLRPPAARIVSIEVEPPTVVLEGARASQRLLVTGRLPGGRMIDVTSHASFTSSRETVATVDAAGAVRPAAEGNAEITARVGGHTTKTRVTVRAAGVTAPVSFLNEVIPVLTRAGCNQGICHGTPNGKAGFRLSLKGYAPESDYDALVRQAEGRRVNVTDPAHSLILRKASGQVRHGGGSRFPVGALEYGILHDWIVQGARSDVDRAARLVTLEVLPARRLLVKPLLSQRLVTLAHFADGSTREVTALTHFSSSDDALATVNAEGQVTGRRRGEVAILCRFLHGIASARLTLVEPQPRLVWAAPAPQNEIDHHVFAKLQLLQIPPSPLCTEEEFLRRAYLDAVGTIPTAEEARAYLTGVGEYAGCTSLQKRARLIEHLLQRPEFVDFWTLKWADLLRIQERRLGAAGALTYHRWLQDSIARNQPLDAMVRELLVAQGAYDRNPAAAYYRVASEPESAAETTAQLFLGVRMGCARCHNHPYERWTQDDYYHLAAFFAQVRAGTGGVALAARAEVQQQRTGRTMPPRFLGGEYPDLAPGADRRAGLARWVTDSANPFFAKSMVNRIWYHLFARGIVEPVDDFRDSNPASHDALLAALARRLVASNYDLRAMVRWIMNSATYQLSARPQEFNRDDDIFFSRATVRILTAEQLVDSVTLVTGVPETNGLRAAQIPGAAADHVLLRAFNRPERSLPCECERERESNLGQALQVISGRAIHDKIRHESGRAATLARSARSDRAIVEELFLATLSRFPREPEMRAAAATMRSGERRAAIEDLMWALINSKEAMTRH